MPCYYLRREIGVGGFEPPASWSQTMRANRCATPRRGSLAEEDSPVNEKHPWRDSNPRSWLRRPVLYPLSYRGLILY